MTRRANTGVDNARLQAIEKIYQGAVMEHAEFVQWDKNYLMDIIAEELARIDLFEDAGREDANAHFAINDALASTIGTIWAVSGIGTYNEPVTLMDNKNFTTKAWAHGMDRVRIDRAVLLAKNITQIRSGQMHITKALMREYGPYLVYNGYDFQNAALLDAVTRGVVMFPVEKLSVISGGQKTTVDQVRTFVLPRDPALKGKDVAVVSHAPHLSRIIHMIPEHKPFPHGMLPYLFSIPTPREGKEEFAYMEMKGLLYYIFLAKVASEVPCSYRLHHAHLRMPQE